MACRCPKYGCSLHVLWCWHIGCKAGGNRVVFRIAEYRGSCNLRIPVCILSLLVWKAKPAQSNMVGEIKVLGCLVPLGVKGMLAV